MAGSPVLGRQRPARTFAENDTGLTAGPEMLSVTPDATPPPPHKTIAPANN